MSLESLNSSLSLSIHPCRGKSRASSVQTHTVVGYGTACFLSLFFDRYLLIKNDKYLTSLAYSHPSGTTGNVVAERETVLVTCGYGSVNICYLALGQLIKKKKKS